MNGSEFVKTFANKGLPAWEAAAFDIARQGGLTPWPMVDLQLQDDQGNVAVLKVATDYLAVGPLEDHLRLPLTPGTAQSILNLSGSLLPTPWLDYQIWRAAPVKVKPQNRVPTVRLADWAAHSVLVEQQIADQRLHGVEGLSSGQKKDIVVANNARPKTVLIHGWYHPDRPDIFDDKKHWEDPKRQPTQVLSNAHADFYVDYSHGVRAIAPVALVNGQPMRTVDLYQHPTLSKLVSNEGPIHFPRYPSNVPPLESNLPPLAAEGAAPLGVSFAPPVFPFPGVAIAPWRSS